MQNRISFQLTTIALAAAFLVGCENLPGSKGTQGAVIGGASGAAVGAAVGGEKNRAGLHGKISPISALFVPMILLPDRKEPDVAFGLLPVRIL